MAFSNSVSSIRNPVSSLRLNSPSSSALRLIFFKLVPLSVTSYREMLADLIFAVDMYLKTHSEYDEMRLSELMDQLSSELKRRKSQ